MIVCNCNNISEREVRQAVGLGVTSMSALRDDLGVATCCGKCHECAAQVLRDCLHSKSEVRVQAQAVQLQFSSITP